MTRPLIIKDLGLIEYEAAYELQKKAVADVIAGGEQRIYFCEHPHVLTLGRLADDRYILTPKEELNRLQIKVLSIDRGGEVTLHTPGQLVVYLILDLNQYGKDLHQYIRHLEEIGIDFLSQFGIQGQRVSGKTGVWVGRDKIISLGVGVKKWVTYHGMGININTDLNLFRLIKPCGLDVHMTSLQKLKDHRMDMTSAKQILEKTLFAFSEKYVFSG